MATAVELRTQYPRFEYVEASWSLKDDSLDMAFLYTMPSSQSEEITPLSFRHSVTFQGVLDKKIAHIPPELLDKLTFCIGMITSFSYWKATASPEIVVHAASLTQEEIRWWHSVLIEGMGEYFFVNQIEFTASDFVTITANEPSLAIVDTTTDTTDTTGDANNRSEKTKNLSLEKDALIPVGGGKDSAVTLELLKEFVSTDKQLGTLLFHAPAAAGAMVETSGLGNPVIVDRQFDPLLLELNANGFLNGHTPFSAQLAFVSIAAAVIHGYRQVVLSNEQSANEGNVLFHGREINHQFSKTFAFEQAFQEYLANHVFPHYAEKNRPRYFSLLRPLYELQIAALFAPLSQYHQRFRSCNRGQKTNEWCCDCPKCLFAYLILFPFLPWGKLPSLFGKDLFADLDLLEDAQELLGVGEKKPLECVGTHEECLVAAHIACKRYLDRGLSLPPLLAWISENVLQYQDNLDTRHAAILSNWNEENALPDDLAAAMQQKVHAVRTLPIPLAALEGRHFVIFGTGREGTSTEAFLRQSFPGCDIDLVDENNSDSRSVKPAEVKLSGRSTIFRSPGIPPTHIWLEFARAAGGGARIHSNTQLFFELVRSLDYPITIIGITGTKGKSTTTMTIAHVLETAGKTVLLGGNIGVPPLSLWLKVLEKASDSTKKPLFIVLELSAHQLADMTLSPDIAVVQDITPEHLDYYADFPTYVQAKSQITRFQTADNWVVYNPTLSTPTQLASLSPAKKLHIQLAPPTGTTESCYVLEDSITCSIDPKSPETILSTTELPLTGEHNILNVLPAVIVAQSLSIPAADIATGLRSLKPLPHRLEPVAEIDGILFVNDSLASAPEAACAAIRSFAHRPIVLIAGGTERNLALRNIAEAITQNSVSAVVLFPPTGETIASLLTELGSSIPRTLVHSMHEAVQTAYAAAKALPRTSRPVVLLSPGSASFGLFKDYADRGEQFREQVLSLSQTPPDDRSAQG